MTLKHAMKWLSVLGLCLVGAAAPATNPAALTLSGRVERPGAWTASRLKDELKSELQQVNYEVKGVHHQSQCVSLDALLRASRVKPEAARKNAVLSLVVCVVARDGYAASFSLAELSPDLGNRAVWLALDMDNHPLDDRDGPVKLIVPDDKKPSRWVHGIATITVSDAASGS